MRGYPWLFLRGYPWLFFVFCILFLKLGVAIRGYSWLSVAKSIFLAAVAIFIAFSWLFVAIRGYFWHVRGYPWLSHQKINFVIIFVAIFRGYFVVIFTNCCKYQHLGHEKIAVK